jgi:hypothetical protein
MAVRARELAVSRLVRALLIWRLQGASRGCDGAAHLHAERRHSTNNYVPASHKDVPAGAGSAAQASINEDEAVPRPSVGLMMPIRHGLFGCVS